MADPASPLGSPNAPSAPPFPKPLKPAATHPAAPSKSLRPAISKTPPAVSPKTPPAAASETPLSKSPPAAASKILPAVPSKSLSAAPSEITASPLKSLPTASTAPPAAPSKNPPAAEAKTPPGTSSKSPLAATPKTPPAAPLKSPPAAASTTPAALSKSPSTAASKTPGAPPKSPPAAASKTPPAAPSKGPPAAASKTPPAAPSKGPPPAASKTPAAVPSKGPPAAAFKPLPAAPSKASPAAASKTPAPSKPPPAAPSAVASAAPLAEAASAPAAAAGAIPSPLPSPPAFPAGAAEGVFPLHVSPICDLQQLSRWEYWLQLSLFTTDLHITAAWRLVSSDAEATFHIKAKALQGPVVLSFIDLDELSPPQLAEDIVRKQQLGLNCRSFLFPAGQCMPPSGFAAAPTGRFWFLACSLALGKVFSLDSREPTQLLLRQTEKLQQQQWNSAAVAFETCDIPPQYGAVALKQLLQSTDGSHSLQGPFRTLYRVRGEEQVLPVALVQFCMQPLRVQVVQPVCALCEILPATVYCPADKAHLCNACDDCMHSSSRMLARHKRVPVNHSPYQFGACPYHPSEMLDSVCVTCSTALCPHCLLIGHHSATAVSSHQLLSTLDAYKLLMQGNSPSEEQLEERKRRIAQELRDTHKQLGELHGNFLAVQRRIHEAAKSLLGQLRGLKERKTRYLLAVKRELLSEMLLIEWLEASFAHLRLALSPSDFLVYKHKYDVALSALFGGDVRVNVEEDAMPPWMGEKFFLEGSLSVTSAPLAIPQLITFDSPAQEALLKSFLPREKGTGSGDSSRKLEQRRSGGALQPEASLQGDEGAQPCDAAVCVSMPSEVDGLSPLGRVPAYQRVLFLPDEPSVTKARSSRAQPSTSFPEYDTSCKDAAPDVQQLPAAIRVATAEKKRVLEKELSSSSMEDMQGMPKEACSSLWGLLSDNGFLPLLTLLKAADNRRRPELIAAACSLANFFAALPDLAIHLIRFELEWVGHLPESLLLHTSSLLYPFLSHVATARELLLPGDLVWLQQLLLPLLAATEAYAKEQHLSSEDLVSESPIKLLRPICMRFHDRLQSLTFCDVPATLRGLLYVLAEAVDYQMRLSYAPRATSSGGARSLYTPPAAQNVVSVAAVAATAEVLLCCVFAAFLTRYAPREQLVPSSACTDKAYTPPYADVREQPPLLGGTSSEAETATKLHTLAETLRRPPAYLAFERMLRELAQACWDPAVLLHEGRQGGHLHLGSTQEGKARAFDAEAVAATRSPFTPEDRFRLDMAAKIFSWCSAQLRLPRLQSPVLFNTTGHAAAEQGASTILRFVLALDTMLREGSFRPPTPDLTEDVVASPAFEELLNFAIKIGIYEQDVHQHMQLV